MVPTEAQASTLIPRHLDDKATDSRASPKQRELKMPPNMCPFTTLDMILGNNLMFKDVQLEKDNECIYEWTFQARGEGQKYVAAGKIEKVAKKEAAEALLLALIKRYTIGKWPYLIKGQPTRRGNLEKCLRRFGIKTTPQQTRGPKQKAKIPQQTRPGPPLTTPPTPATVQKTGSIIIKVELPYRMVKHVMGQNGK
ncbi:unnamed protein product, partial [Meganyctiphanes norvegica]